jgi:hypothetical protein
MLAFSQVEFRTPHRHGMKRASCPATSLTQHLFAPTCSPGPSS